MKNKLLQILLCYVSALIFIGCASTTTEQSETAPDGTIKKTRVRAFTFWDSKSDLATLRTTSTDKSQGVAIAGLAQESTSTNATAQLQILADVLVKAVLAAPK